jgi:GntR family transcriptional regulator, rspAB operon transcriptional repressor
MNVKRMQSINSSTIYTDLLDKIISLKYKPGEGLSENELCEVYGATRHAIRGALAILKEKGLIEVQPQRGTNVSLIDLKFIDDIIFLRSAIEQETLHFILKNDDNTELVKQLRKCLDKQIRAEDSGVKSQEFYKLDDEFHDTLLAAAGRKSVQKIYADAYLHVRRWRNMEVSAQARIASLPQEHKKIVDAIEKRDEAEARRLMFSHIDSVGLFGEEMRHKYPEYFVQ